MRSKLKVLILLWLVSLLLSPTIYSQEAIPQQIHINQKTYPLYPELLQKPPDIPSPFTTEDGQEIVIAITKDGKYTLIPVTVENGEPWINEGKRGKGQQLDVEAEDFPTLARLGLHSEIELDYTKMITGRSVAEITENGRPNSSSGVGFLAQDEDIISVLKGDNRLLKKMGLTHPLLAKPLFHIFNIIRLHEEKQAALDRPLERVESILYNGKRIRLIGWESGHGWQESIFNDEIKGFYQINFSHELNSDEKSYLAEKYYNLNEDQMSELIHLLSTVHIGEMAAFYIMRYGFYEGHTGYRADPIALAFIFGLRSIEELDKAFEGKLYQALTDHHVR